MMENNIQTNVGGRGSKKKRRAQQKEEKEKEKRKGEEKEEKEKERKKMDDQERKMLTVAFHKFIKNSDLIIEEKEKLSKIESPNT
jgi:hypothetical protein